MKKLLFTSIITVMSLPAFGQLDIVKRDLTATRQITIRDTTLLDFVKHHGSGGSGGSFEYVKTLENSLNWTYGSSNFKINTDTSFLSGVGFRSKSMQIRVGNVLTRTDYQSYQIADLTNELNNYINASGISITKPPSIKDYLVISLNKIYLNTKTKQPNGVQLIQILNADSSRFEVANNFTKIGDIPRGRYVNIDNTSGYVKALVPHANMQFMDSTVTWSLTQNTWYQITRQSSRNTWPDSELVGFTSNGDSLICPVSGHYNITCKVNITGVASKDYEYRIMKKTATSGSTPTEVWRYQVSGTGTRVLRDISSYINLNATDRCWIELRSVTAAPGSVTLHGGEFLINPVHLFL